MQLTQPRQQYNTIPSNHLNPHESYPIFISNRVLPSKFDARVAACLSDDVCAYVGVVVHVHHRNMKTIQGTF